MWAEAAVLERGAAATAPVRVAILGCGQIGSRWDAPGSEAHAAGGPSLTHAAAFGRRADAQVVAFCDSEPDRAAQAVAAWGRGQAYTDAAALFAAQPVDLAVIATHSSVRREVVATALAAGVRHFVIEKPLATTLGEARALVQDLHAAGARALVNYSRHWDPALAELRARIDAGQMGRLQRLVALYGKGLANSASHMIDLVGLLCRARPVRVRALGSPLPTAEADWSQGLDPAVDAQVVFETADGRPLQLDLLATDTNAFTCFELKLVGSAAICEIRLGGRRIEWQAITDDPHFAGYRIPGPREILPARNLETLDRMADEALALARGQIDHASCDAANALDTAATVAAIRRAAACPSPQWLAIED